MLRGVGSATESQTRRKKWKKELICRVQLSLDSHLLFCWKGQPVATLGITPFNIELLGLEHYGNQVRAENDRTSRWAIVQYIMWREHLTKRHLSFCEGLRTVLLFCVTLLWIHWSSFVSMKCHAFGSHFFSFLTALQYQIIVHDLSLITRAVWYHGMLHQWQSLWQ